MGTPLGTYVTRIFDDLWNNADTCMAIDDYFSVRAWLGRYVQGVYYLRGWECPCDSASRPDLWLLLTGAQFSQAADYLAGGYAIEIDDAVPGRYYVEQRSFDLVRRVAVQKYGESTANTLGIALAATRTASVSSGKP